MQDPLFKYRSINIDRYIDRKTDKYRALTTTGFNIFCWSFTYVSYLPMSTNECSGFF